MDKALSDLDVQKYVSNVILYNQLSGIGWKQLLEMMPVVILYETRPGYGHWTLLHRLKNGWVEFFDSYGFIPDQEWKVMGMKYEHPYVLYKLLEDINKHGIQIHYNQFGFQDWNPSIKTCGRWVILRSMFSDLTVEQFAKGIDAVSKSEGISPDELAVKMVNV